MDSRVVHSHVEEENNEQNSQNIEPYPVTLTHGPEEDHTASEAPEKKSVMSRVKAKARKVRDSIKKLGTHNTPDDVDDHDDLDEDEDEDKEMVQDPQVHQVPREEIHYNPLVGDVPLTNETNQNIATDKTKPFAVEEKQEQYKANLDRPIGLEEDSQEQESKPEAYTLPNYQTKDIGPNREGYDNEDVKSARQTPEFEQVENLGNSGIDFDGTKVKGEETHHDSLLKGVSSTTETNENIATDKANLERPTGLEEGSKPEAYTLPNYQTKDTDSYGKGSDEIKDTTPLEESLERLNVHDDEPNLTTEPKTRSYVADIEYPSAVGSYDQFVPHFSDETKTKNEYPRETVSTDIDRNQEILEEDSQDQGSRTEADTLPNHPINYTDPSGAESDKLKDITPLEESLAKLVVHDDEPKPIIEPNTADTEYSPAAGSHDATETQNEYLQETVSTDINRNQEISSETEETFNTITNTAEKQPDYEESVETQPKNKSYTDETEISTAETADKTLLPESYEAYNVSNDETETKSGDKGDNAKDYLAQKLRPSGDYKPLSEVITEDLHTRKEESLKEGDGKMDSEVEKSEKVSGESNVNSPGKGMVGRVKDYYGSWFAKPEENQSPQGAGNTTEDLSKSKDSVAEVEQVGKVVE